MPMARRRLHPAIPIVVAVVVVGTGWWATRRVDRAGARIDEAIRPSSSERPADPAERPDGTAEERPGDPAERIDARTAHGVPGASDEDARFVAEFGGPTPELIRARLEQALETSFPDRKLSSDELERAASALVRLRETRMALDALAFDPSTSNERRRLVEELGRAAADFSDVLEMDPAEFTARVAGSGNGSFGSGGIDREEGLPAVDFEPPFGAAEPDSPTP